MTDQLTGVGSEQSGNPPGGNGEEGKGSASPTAATGNAGPGEPGNLDWAKSKGWVAEDGSVKTEAVFDGYRNLEKKLGTMLSVPGEQATPEERQRFEKALGVPEKAEGYEFKRPESLPADLPYDEAMANRFKQWAHEARLPPSAAQKLHDQYVGQFAEDLKAWDAEQGQKAKAAHEEIVKAWGDPKSEDYAKNKDAAIRALRSEQFKGLEEELKQSGLLTKDGVYTSPRIAQLLAAVGKQSQNDTFLGIDGKAVTGNPFDPQSFNLTEASRLANSEPAKARALAAAAGRSPEWIKETLGI